VKIGKGAIKILFALFLAWYISGPVAMVIDHWDGAREELRDIVWSAGGGVTLIAAAAGFWLSQVRRLRRLSAALSQNRGPRIKACTSTPRLITTVESNHFLNFLFEPPPLLPLRV
jgi:hypothetical protein